MVNYPKRGRPKKTEEEKLRGYRYNLNLDKDLQQYLKEIAWMNRTSITQYINDLIRADMEAFLKTSENVLRVVCVSDNTRRWYKDGERE